MSKYIEIEGEVLRWCNGCKTHLPINLFGYDRKSADELAYRCRVCNNKHDFEPTKYVYEAKQVLEALGYETDPNYPKTIHEQFTERHKQKLEQNGKL